MQFIQLETERLFLKGISNEMMLRIFNELPKIEIMELLGHVSEQEFEQEYQKHLNGYSSYNRSFILFLLIDKSSEKIIGRCGIHNWNKENHRAEVGYVMHDESFKQKGLMSEAFRTIINYAFLGLKLNRLEALVGEHNEASLRLLMKNNFRQEGILRQHLYKNERYENSILYALLRSEF